MPALLRRVERYFERLVGAEVRAGEWRIVLLFSLTMSGVF